MFYLQIVMGMYCVLFLSSGFINGASLFKDSGGHKVVALMMFVCAGLFVINAILEIILLRKVCTWRVYFNVSFLIFLTLNGLSFLGTYDLP
jgi:hypothetical protein